MAKHEPFFFDKNLKAMDGPEIGIKQETGEGARLSRAIPAVRAMN
jgi:hypothetical protein